MSRPCLARAITDVSVLLQGVPQLQLPQLDAQRGLDQGAPRRIQLLGANEDLQPAPGIGWVIGSVVGDGRAHRPHAHAAGPAVSSGIVSENPGEGAGR